MGTILKVEDINVYYGSIHAIKGISFEVQEGEIVTLIGANGAGKSTTLNTVVRSAAQQDRFHLVFRGRAWPRCPAIKWWPRAWPWFRRDGGSSCR